MSGAAPSPGARTWRAPLLLLALALGVLSVLGACAAISYQVADSNTAAHLEIARKCVEVQQCGGIPAPAPGLSHGAIHIRLIEWTLRTGADLTRVQSVVLAMLVVSAALLFSVTWHAAGLPAAVLSLGVYLPLALTTSDFRSLDNPNLLPLPLAFYYAATVLFAESRRTAFAVLASIGLAAAVSADLVCMVLVPFHLGVVVQWGRRPLVAVAVSCAVLVLAFALDSPDAAWAIGERLVRSGALAGVVICAALVFLVALRRIRLFETLRAIPPSARIRAAMRAALLFGTAAVWLGGAVFGIPLPPEYRYYAPVIFPLVFLAADAAGCFAARRFAACATAATLSALLLIWAPRASVIGRVPVEAVVPLAALGIALALVVRRGDDRWVRSAVGVVLCLLALAVTLPDALFPSFREAAGFRLAQGEAIVSRLYAAGYTYPQIAGSLQGPMADQLLPLVAARDPRLLGALSAVPEGEFTLLVLKVPRAELSDTQGIVARFDMDPLRSAIAVRSDGPFLNWLQADVCPTTATADAPLGGCLKLLAAQPLRHAWPYLQAGVAPFVPDGSAADREQPGGAATGSWLALPDATAYRRGHDPLRVRMPIRTRGRGVPHVIQAGDLGSEESWRIVGVSGVEFTGELPGPQIRVPDAREAVGVVEFEVTGANDKHPWNWLRHPIELDAANAHLLHS